MAAASFFCIEAGDSVIKVCLIDKKGKSGRGRIAKAFMFRTPEGTVSDGVIIEPALLAEKLRDRLVENGVSAVKNVVFTLASGKVATREVSLPPVKENRIRALLDANMNEYFPMDVSKYQIDYGMVRDTDDGAGNKGIALTIMAAPLTIVDSYARFARAAGLTIDAIDYAGNSQFQLIKSLGNRKVTMYINVECQYTYVTIASGNALIFQRILPCGGNDYIDTYMSAAPSAPGYMDALAACCIPLDQMRSSRILSEEAIDDSLSRVVSGVRRSMDFFNTLRWKDPLEEIVLLGPCARLAGLREMIAESTGYDVYYFEDSPAAAPLGGDAAIISRVVSAYGASIAPVGLLPAEMIAAAKGKKKGEGEEKGPSIIIFAAVAIVIALVGGVMAFMALEENRRLTEEVERIEAEIERTRYIEAVEEAYYKYLSDAAAFTDLELQIASEMNNKGLVSFFEELERKMPQGLLALSAVCDNDGVVMSVRTLTLEAAAKVLVEFRSFDSLDLMKVGTPLIAEGTTEAGIVFYEFTISCPYYIAPEVEEEVEAAGE